MLATWTAANGGDWSAGGNWGGGAPPNAMEDAVFDGSGFGPVTIDAMAADAKFVRVDQGFTFQHGYLTFDLKGHTLTSEDLKIGTTVNSFLDLTSSVPGGKWELGGSGEAVEIGKDVGGVLNVDTRVTLNIFNEVHVGESSQSDLPPQSKFTVTGNSTVAVDGQPVKLGYGTNTWGLLKISDWAIFSTVGAARNRVMIVGENGLGELIVEGESTKLKTGQPTIGRYYEGNATVDDQALWEAVETTYVGRFAQGKLTVANDAVFRASNPNPAVDDFLYVGHSTDGDGTLHVVNGGIAQADFIVVGNEQQSVGLVKVEGGLLMAKNGAGAFGEVQVGKEPHSEGTVEVISFGGLGGKIESGSMFVGVEGGFDVMAGEHVFGKGTVEISGTGSRWTTNAESVIGVKGQGLVGVGDGGKLYIGLEGARRKLTIGQQPNSDGGLEVGPNGYVESGDAIIAEENLENDKAKGKVLVWGDNAQWKIDGNFTQGDKGDATVVVRLGGFINAKNIKISKGLGSTARLEIDGSGAGGASRVVATEGDIEIGAGDSDANPHFSLRRRNGRPS